MVYARMLGPASIRFGPDRFEPSASRTSALLYHLACRGGWVDRGDLVFLLWPDHGERQARRRLSHLLTRIRALPYTEGVEAEPSRLRWRVQTDVQEFLSARKDQDRQRALNLYGGRLLEGFHPRGVPEFDAWLELERQTLFRAWRETVLAQASALAAEGRTLQASDLLHALLLQDPFDEEALRRQLECLHRGGRTAAAVNAFETFRETLERELASAPQPTTVRLVERIRLGEPAMPRRVVPATAAGTSRPTAAPARAPSNLPGQTTSFVGRTVELEELAAHLADPGCRLLNLVGPGGIGKSRLAVEAARAQLESFEHGISFVPLVEVGSPEAMTYAVADAVGVVFSGRGDPQRQLLEYLATRSKLLVLDNLEHLLEGVPLLTGILEAAPAVKVLATSRETLNLQVERVFELGGLSLPDEREAASGDGDAATLFRQRATNRRPDLPVDRGSTEAIVRICRLVGGMPLAIELAASWVHVLTPQDIANEIEQGIGLLRADRRDLPERHHSIRAVFDHSWEFLTERERQVDGKLAVFRGGFRREAAAEVAGASLSVLSGLVDKSFLNATPTGRYEQHPLLQQYGRQKLAGNPGEQARIEERHGLYYLRLLQRLERGLRQRDLRRAVAEDLDNIKAAWRWAIAEVRVEELRRSAEPLYIYFGMSRHPGGHSEGLAVLTQARAVLRESDPDHHAALGYVLVEQAEHLVWLARLEEARLLARRALELLEPLGESRGLIPGYWILGYVAQRGGDDARAVRFYEKGLVQAGSDLPWYRGVMKLSLLSIALPHASLPEARNRFFAFLDELKDLGETDELIVVLQSHYGIYLIEHDRPHEAQPLLEECLELAREVEAQHYVPSILRMLATTASRLGDQQEAQKLLWEALRLVKEQGSTLEETSVCQELGKVMIRLGDDHNARRYLTRSLELAWSMQERSVAYSLLVSLTEIHLSSGRREQALIWLAFLLHPSAPDLVKAEARGLLDRFQGRVSPEELAEAQTRTIDLTLADVIAELLPGHPLPER